MKRYDIDKKIWMQINQMRRVRERKEIEVDVQARIDFGIMRRFSNGRELIYRVKRILAG